jgi:cytoskeletal protein CcmA (bactofilin family)
VSTEYPNDLIDGRDVPPLVVTGDYVLSGTHDGTVQVEAGHFELSGRLRGTLNLHPGSMATIAGTQAGTVSVASGASIRVTGAIEGTTSVERRGELVVEAGAKLAGTLHNDGLVIIRGAFGGAQSGIGELRLEDQGYIKQPRIEGGIHYYEW